MHVADGTDDYRVPEHQRRVDEVIASVRREGSARPSLFKPPPPRPNPSEDPLDLRLAEELEVIRRRLDQLADILASEPIMLHRYGPMLQSLDLTDQVLGHLARVIGSREKGLAVEQITLTELKGRLNRRPLRVAAR
jgi:hypothetical protein